MNTLITEIKFEKNISFENASQNSFSHIAINANLCFLS